jgi:hypothetical protein
LYFEGHKHPRKPEKDMELNEVAQRPRLKKAVFEKESVYHKELL